MRTSRAAALTSFAFAVALAMAALAVPASAAAPASVPTWQVGQSVGYGTSLDLGSLANSYILDAIRTSPSVFNVTSIRELNATGSFDHWEVDQVTGKTSTYYVLSSQAAEGLKFHLAINVTVNALPKAGTYTGTIDPILGCVFRSIPVTTGPVALDVDATALTVVNSETRYQVSNLSYVNATGNSNVRAHVVVSSFNLPMIDTNRTSCVETVQSGSPTFSLTVNTQDQLRSLFTPTWNYFDFPMTDNKTWWANTTATIGATIAGTIDVTGLSGHDETAFFDNLTKAFQSAGLVVTGLSSFPIDLAKITITAGLDHILQNGVIQDYPAPLHANYRATASVMTLSDGNQYPVYLITDASYRCPTPPGNVTLPVGYAAVYAPDFPAQGAGMIVGYELLVCLGSLSQPAFSLTNTKPAEAQQKIGQTESTYQIAPPAQANAIANFFLQAPYWGVLVVVVAVAAIVGLLVFRRRRRPGTSPPPAQPMQTPPRPPPPGAP